MKRLVLLLFLFLSITAPASAGVTFTGDFETGDLSQWALVQNCDPSRSFVYSHASTPSYPIPLQGTYAMREQAANADRWDGNANPVCSTTYTTKNPRAQVGSSNLLVAGNTYVEQFAVYVPTDFPSAVPGSDWFLFQEDFGEPFEGSPPLSFGIDNIAGFQSFTVDWCPDGASQCETRWSTPITKGSWHVFEVLKKMSTADNGTAGNGVMDLKFDGAIQTFNATTVSGRSEDRGTASWTGAGANTRIKVPTMDPSPHINGVPTTNSSYRFYNNVYYGPGINTSPIPRLFFDCNKIATTTAEAEIC